MVPVAQLALMRNRDRPPLKRLPAIKASDDGKFAPARTCECRVGIVFKMIAVFVISCAMLYYA